MRRLSASLLAASLLASSAGSASAQEPVETPTATADEGQRLEFDEPGFAVTVPGDWEVSLFEPPLEDGWPTWAVASGSIDEPSEQSCVFSTGGPSAARLGDPERWAEPAPLLEWLELPGGRALFFEDRQDPSSRRDLNYIFARGANSYIINCSATELPEDRWLSIAASFEFLRDDPHIVVVRPGVTMSFPIEWNVLEDHGQLAGAPGWERVFWATDGEASCRVAYDTRMLDPELELTADELHAEYLDYVSLSADRSVDTLVVDLPVGSAWRADWEAGPEGRETDHSVYQIAIGKTVLRVACLRLQRPSATDAPEDRWLSVVETLEFLPAEQ